LDDLELMGAALDEARAARDAGEVPIGAVIARDGRIVARGANRTVRDNDATTHAEIVAIREASRVVRSWRLEGLALFVTIEPCAMCAGAIVLARLDRVVFGAWDDKAGMAGSVGDLLRHPRLNHRPQVLGGVREEECGALVREFFRERRAIR
jgi:tRNA(adenine34) deaminase